MGSNLGDRRQHLALAVATLEKWLPGGVVAVSSIYRTPPWGPVPQDDYYNIAIIASSPDLDAYGWLDMCRKLEEAAGRVRDIRWGPRTLDADVVVVDDIVSQDPDLTLPHPRAHQRAFVLLPWAEIDPDAVLLHRGPILSLLAGLDSTEISAVRHDG